MSFTPIDFNIIVAHDSCGGIARLGQIPWSATPEGKADLAAFKQKTMNGVVIMGRKTYNSIPEKFRPLPNRVNIILSSTHTELIVEGALCTAPVVRCNSLISALEFAKKQYPDKQRWVIGGSQVYAEALKYNFAHLDMTEIPGDYKCDLIFPDFARWRGGAYGYDRNPAEMKYLHLLQRLMMQPARPNRTGIPTHGLFSENLKFPLMDHRGAILPLLTTKRTNLRAVIVELIWFLRGSTDTKYLLENNVHIWDDNSTRTFLDSRGLDYPEGTLGPIYGSQWRNWNGVGIDQINNVLDTLKRDPFCRRMIVSAWNPEQIPNMALPPCHMMFQVYCDVVRIEDKDNIRINLHMTMRSADVALGVPFNIASYALLTHMLAKITGYIPGELSITMVDCHVYSTHIDGIKRQLGRTPFEFPTFKFSERLANATSIDDFTQSEPADYIIEGYNPYPGILLKMAI